RYRPDQINGERDFRLPKGLNPKKKTLAPVFTRARVVAFLSDIPSLTIRSDLQRVQAKCQFLRFARIERNRLLVDDRAAVAIQLDLHHIVRPLRARGELGGREGTNAASSRGLGAGQVD